MPSNDLESELRAQVLIATDGALGTGNTPDWLINTIMALAVLYATRRTTAVLAKQALNDHKFITEVIDLLDQTGTLAHDTATDEKAIGMLKDWQHELEAAKVRQARMSIEHVGLDDEHQRGVAGYEVGDAGVR